MVNSMRLARALGSLTFLALASLAHAQQQVQFSTTLPSTPVPGSNAVQLPRFDSALGALVSVQLQLSGSVSGTLGFENTAAAPTNAPPYGVGVLLGGTHPSGAFAPPPNPAFEYTPVPAVVLGAFDGVVDNGGTSGVTVPFTNETGTGMPSMTYTVFQDASLGVWAGPAGAPGNFTATVQTTDFSGGFLPLGVLASYTVTATITLTVTYNYFSLPAPICRANANSGCPCSNPSPIGAGCLNSSGSSGGFFTVIGNSSLSNDTLQFQVGGLPSSATVLYFQGTSFSYAQNVLGNGLRCVGGTVRRIAIRQANAAGLSAYPVANETQIRLLGAITAPGTRTYQVHYRDTIPSCTGATSNLTNGYLVAWTP